MYESSAWHGRASYFSLPFMFSVSYAALRLYPLSPLSYLYHNSPYKTVYVTYRSRDHLPCLLSQPLSRYHSQLAITRGFLAAIPAAEEPCSNLFTFLIPRVVPRRVLLSILSDHCQNNPTRVRTTIAQCLGNKPPLVCDTLPWMPSRNRATLSCQISTL